MKFGPMIALVFTAGLCASDAPPGINVNSRYLIEQIDISEGGKSKISRTLREDLESLVGQKLNPAALDKMARRIRSELQARHVTEKVSRGTQPDHVVVLFEVDGRKPASKLDLTLRKGVYQAKQGWSGELDSVAELRNNKFTLGLTSDGDELLERFAGVRADYERTHAGTERLGFGFQLASYHESWNPSTVASLEAAGDVPYRSRLEFTPTVKFTLTDSLTLTAGASFDRLENQSPAARTESANAVLTTLRFARRLEDSQATQHDVTAGYSLRAATSLLGSDLAYTCQTADVGYAYTNGKHRAAASFMVGHESGNPPLFERFAPGNSSMLRGWNKFDVNPLGGTRLVYGSVDYRYGVFEVFYDSGALWNKGGSPEGKYSAGLGLRTKGGFFLALAFPIRSGRAEPVFMAGIGD